MLLTMRAWIERHKVFHAVVAPINIDVMDVPTVRDGAVLDFPLGAMKELAPLVTACAKVSVRLLVVANPVE